MTQFPQYLVLSKYPGLTPDETDIGAGSMAVLAQDAHGHCFLMPMVDVLSVVLSRVGQRTVLIHDRRPLSIINGRPC